MKLLLSAFEPFGGEAVNPSGAVLRAIEGVPVPDIELTAVELPVRGGVSVELLVTAFERGNYDAWLGLGQAGGRPQLSVERMGVNLLIDRDSESAAMVERPLVEEAPAAYFAGLPVRELAERMTAAGAPATVSNDAGTYICNEALYVMRHHLATGDSELPSGFVHVPYLPQQLAGKPPGTPSMALETQTLGVRTAIEFIRELVAERGAVRGRRQGRPHEG